jgi:SAM-dependent methyltransferase
VSSTSASGFGRHVYECARRGAHVVALDYAADEVVETRNTLAAMVEAGEITADKLIGVLRADARRLPFPDATFDVVITSEVLEHIQDDVAAISEMVRVLKPGGRFAATVPAWMPEVVNWKLSDEYHAPKSVGGHVRIYTPHRAAGEAARRRPRRRRLPPRPRPALAVLVAEVRGRTTPRRPPRGRQVPQFLEWDIIEQPRSTRVAERVLSPVLGKSSVHYATKPRRTPPGTAHPHAATSGPTNGTDRS